MQAAVTWPVAISNANAKIRQFITGWNTRKHPFIWTKTPGEILAQTRTQEDFAYAPLASRALGHTVMLTRAGKDCVTAAVTAVLPRPG